MENKIWVGKVEEGVEEGMGGGGLHDLLLQTPRDPLTCTVAGKPTLCFL